jgi:hypothetical protein
MATKYTKGVAPYMFDAATSWCDGTGTGQLSSKGFGSCVGLVLYCPSTTIGAVAHFSGSLGKPVHQETARKDAEQILLSLRTAEPLNWNAWLFGGDSLSKTSSSASTISALDLKTGTVEQTKALMDIVRKALDDDGHFAFTYRTEGYPGHSAVVLNLADGTVAFS